tara:strand:- start:5190 stop:5993 length:804 start_codon:yes stop_codon:yes gene_type:complete
MSSKQKVSTPKAKRNNNKNSIPRSKRTVKPQPNDETFMKIIVQFHNQRDQQINAEKIYAYKTNLKSLPENLKKQLEDAFGGNIPETKRFPPGKDKIQFIQKYWIDNKIATYKKKRLVLAGPLKGKFIRQKWRTEMKYLENEISKLERKDKFDEFDFYHYFALNQSCESLPSRIQIRDKTESIDVRRKLLEFQLDWANEKLNILQKIRRRIMEDWNTDRFQKIEDMVTLVMTAGIVKKGTIAKKMDLDKEINIKTIEAYQKNIKNSFK